MTVADDNTAEISGNDYTGAVRALRLMFMDGITFSAASGNVGFNTVSDLALELYRSNNSHITGLDLSWTGAGQVCKGLQITASSNNLIENLTAVNRSTAIEVDLFSEASGHNTIRGNNVSGSVLGIDAT